MLRNTLALAAALTSVAAPAFAQKAHGSDAQGSVMGPVAFMWPEDRPWSASEDNKGPCGSSAGISNRTDFPLAGGSVALSIADDATKVKFRIAYNDNPTQQSQFEDFIPTNVDKIEAGHQCYRAPEIKNDVTEGTKATIQMEYISNDSGKDESFYACADIKFVAVKNFAVQIPCFNVTSSEFEAPESTSAAKTENKPTEKVTESTSERDLTTGEKAGIAVGSILGASAIIGLAVFFGLRKRRSHEDHEAQQRNMAQTKAASIISH